MYRSPAEYDAVSPDQKRAHQVLYWGVEEKWNTMDQSVEQDFCARFLFSLFGFNSLFTLYVSRQIGTSWSIYQIRRPDGYGTISFMAIKETRWNRYFARARYILFTFSPSSFPSFHALKALINQSLRLAVFLFPPVAQNEATAVENTQTKEEKKLSSRLKLDNTSQRRLNSMYHV